MGEHPQHGRRAIGHAFRTVACIVIRVPPPVSRLLRGRNAPPHSSSDFISAGRCLSPPTLRDNPNCTTMRGWRIQEMSRSEEHTSELQSLMRISYAVFCLKKKNINHIV